MHIIGLTAAHFKHLTHLDLLAVIEDATKPMQALSDGGRQEGAKVGLNGVGGFQQGPVIVIE